MKRFLVFSISVLFSFLYDTVNYEDNLNQANPQFVVVQAINNELYKDVTVRFISPYVHEAINSYYQFEDSLTQHLNTAPSIMCIVKVDRVGNIDNFDAIIASSKGNCN